MRRMLEQLMRQSYLFDDPDTYQAGVEDAVAALRSLGLLVEDIEREEQPA